jgi:hypothetical protein
VLFWREGRKKRWGLQTPRDIANTTVFLASDNAAADVRSRRAAKADKPTSPPGSDGSVKSGARSPGFMMWSNVDAYRLRLS